MTSHFQLNTVQEQIANRLADPAIHPLQIVLLQYLIASGHRRGTILPSPNRFGDLFHLSSADTIDKHVSNGFGNLGLTTFPATYHWGMKLPFRARGMAISLITPKRVSKSRYRIPFLESVRSSQR